MLHLHHTQQRFSAFGKCGLYGPLFLAAMLGLTMFAEPEAMGADTTTTVAYLQPYIPKGSPGLPLTPTTPELPSSGPPDETSQGYLGTSNLAGNTGLNPRNVFEDIGPFNLPGYGDSVYVDLDGDIPQTTWAPRRVLSSGKPQPVMPGAPTPTFSTCTTTVASKTRTTATR